jgi:hypothetical protein
VKQKKWLLILVIFVLAINITYLILMRWAKVDQYARKELADFLAAQLDADVSIGDFSFNDKQLNISEVSIKKRDEQYAISVRQIYVEYNLLKLLFSRFKDLSQIQHIRIQEPEIEFRIVPSKKEKKKPFEIPDLQNLFQNVSITKGKFYIVFEMKHFGIEEYFEKISLSMQNGKKKAVVKGSAQTIGSGELTFQAEVTNKSIEHASRR